MTAHDHLPDVYVSEQGENIGEPAYRLSTSHFFDATYWVEGEILVTNLEPTAYMEPLNRAAGERVEKWLMSLPQDGKDLTLADLTEAAMMLRPREGEPELTTEQFQAAVLNLASKLRDKRRGNEPFVPQTQNVRPAASKPAAPLANARFADARNFEQERRVQYQPQTDANKVRKAKPVTSNAPQGARA